MVRQARTVALPVMGSRGISGREAFTNKAYTFGAIDGMEVADVASLRGLVDGALGKSVKHSVDLVSQRSATSSCIHHESISKWVAIALKK